MTGDAGVQGPLVLLDLDHDAGAFELVLVNCGDEPALDIRVEFSRKLTGIGGSAVISELPLWSGLGMLRPGKEIRVFLDAASNVFRKRSPRKFTATVTWRDLDGNTFDETYRHDLDAFRDVPEIVRPD